MFYSGGTKNGGKRFTEEAMIISVTQEDIDKGVLSSIDDCAIAIALRRKVGGYGIAKSYVFTALGSVVRLPNNARRFIAKFDAGLPVKPFNFRLNVEAK